MIRRTIVPKTKESRAHCLEPFIRDQLKQKGWNGDFYEPYDPDPCRIDLQSARAGAGYGTDISEGITVTPFNIPAGHSYLPAVATKAAILLPIWCCFCTAAGLRLALPLIKMHSAAIWLRLRMLLLFLWITGSLRKRCTRVLWRIPVKL